MQSTVEWLAAQTIPTLSFDKLLGVLRALGADPDVLTAQNWAVPSIGPLGAMDLEDREDAIFRLTTSLGIFAKYVHLFQSRLRH